MSHTSNLRAGKALARLKEGNERYLTAQTNDADISPAIRLRTSREGQTPYAVVLTCSDSRVIPESIFSAGIGELFVIRVAGNVVDDHQLGSIEYAVDHLGTRLIVVLGHTGCGAVGAAIAGPQTGFVASITDEIRRAIGGANNDYEAGCLNARHSVDRIVEALHYGSGGADGTEDAVHVIAAMVHIDTGRVEFL